MPNVEITVDWPDRASTRGWRILSVVAIDEHDVMHQLQIIKATRPIKLTRRKSK